jgi:hypothetical protein
MTTQRTHEDEKARLKGIFSGPSYSTPPMLPLLEDSVIPSAGTTVRGFLAGTYDERNLY